MSYTDGIMTITATNGYERARDLKLTADGQQIGHGTELWDRFDALEPAFRKFWKELEQDATDWQAGRELAANTKDENQKQQDAAFCAKVLSAYTSE